MSARPSPEASPSRSAGQEPDAARLLTEAITQLHRALRSSIQTDSPRGTLPMAQVELLQVLGEQSPAHIGDLTARRHLAPSTVSGLISRIIGAGLVARDVDPADHRSSVVTLTDAGRERLAAWTRDHKDHMATAFAALDDHERAVIAEALPVLFRLAEHLDEQTYGTDLG
ncbi:MarR family transcriptional regulator [Streptomyces fodineus]|uniref:MarR family transcriptional regulator n=1 Tax=Streptomyces fodineus TaxID=1904616 RepID=A0A1D7Y315_9ACTN|nr:MarR family winged helix-turn-helix transcriptional regulator [Streptomyces fodineus]AOR29958.1 MarR family transcriptional regulator [Streptomyces fodineus]